MTNQNESPNSTLLSFVLQHSYTRNGANQVIDLIQRVFEHYLFSGNPSLTSLKKAIIQFSEKNILSKSEKLLIIKLGDLNITIGSSQLYSIIETIQSAIKEYPLLIIYVPSALEADGIYKIGLWARKNLHQNTMLSFIIDPLYCGGCGISWQGKFKDYSYFQNPNNKLFIINELRKYN